MANELSLIKPDWPAPSNVKTFVTTRVGGVSKAPFNSLNLALHVGDELAAVEVNRQRLSQYLSLPAEPAWLEQVHGTGVVTLPISTDCTADASYTRDSSAVCVVMTADCLPVVFCNSQGTEVAAAHAGWRGLLDGVLESTVEHFNSKPEDIVAWLGPAISIKAFEVGDEVREAFVHKNPESKKAFVAGDSDKWYADLYELARLRLGNIGLTQVYGGSHCTFEEEDLFYSYRREGQTGRMATLIWRE